MRITPKTEEQLKEESNILWPDGEYEFEISDKATFGQKEVRTDDGVSSSGNDMIVLVVRVFNASGKPRFLTDYLTEAMGFKLRHACDACGLLDKYQSGELHAHDFIGKFGKLLLKTQPAKGEYKAKNVVDDYVKRLPQNSAHSVAKGNAYQPEPIDPNHPAYDPDIPF